MASMGRNLARGVRHISVLRIHCCACKVASSLSNTSAFHINAKHTWSVRASDHNVQIFTSTSERFRGMSSKVKEQVDADNLEHFEITKEQMPRFVEEILTTAGKADIMARTVNRQGVKELFEDLLMKGWSPKLIREVFISFPVYLTRSTSQLLRMIDTFTSFGFNSEQVANLMRSGAVTKFKAGSLSDTLDALRNIGMKDKKLPQILTNYPELLLQNPGAIVSRATALKALFKTDDVVPLVLGAPNIMFDDWSKIHEIFHYVFSEMGIKQRQMVKSKLFSYPLNFVRTRHIFVWKAGMFVKPHRDDDPVRKTNPRLTDILDTSDERFAKTFGNMTLKDYKAFSALMKREFAAAKRENDDTTTDDEDDR